MRAKYIEALRDKICNTDNTHRSKRLSKYGDRDKLLYPLYTNEGIAWIYFIY